MKKAYIIIGALALAGLSNGCKKVEQFVGPKDSTKVVTTPVQNDSVKVDTSVCKPTIVDFMAGQHTDIGDVEITNDSANLFVTYRTTDGWTMTETHLYVGDLAQMPKSQNGNPKIGNFPYKTSFSPGVNSYTYTIPLAQFGKQECISIVAHAATQKLDAAGKVLAAETAWTAGKQLNDGGSWAMYTTYCICNPSIKEDTNDDTNVGGIEGN